MLHTKYKSFGSGGFRDEGFFFFFFFFSFHFLWKIMTARDRPVLTPGTRLEEFIKRSTIHCYTQNMKALGLVVSEMFSHCKSM